MREEAEEAAEIIKTSGLADQGILDRLGNMFGESFGATKTQTRARLKAFQPMFRYRWRPRPDQFPRIRYTAGKQNWGLGRRLK